MTQNQQAPVVDETIAEAPIVKHDLANLENVKVAGELDLLTAAKAFAASGMFPDVQRQSQAVVKIIAGYELGVKPFAAMRGIHFIQFGSTGVLELSANLRGALIKRSGQYDYRVRHLDDESCRIEFYERAPGGGPFESVGFSEYSVAQAKTAKIFKPDGTWGKYPEDMCFAAALRRGAKRFCPDLFVGELEMDDASAATAVVEQELAGDRTVTEEVVDVEAVEAETIEGEPADAPSPSPASTEGDEGAADNAGAAGSAAAPEVAVDATLFGDGTPPEPDGEEVPDGEPIYIGLLAVAPAPDAHEHQPFDDTADRIDVQRINRLRQQMPRIQLVGGALERVFKARYGFDLRDARHATADAFESWIEAEITKVKAVVG